ncbi:MAG: CotH kinase family protein [Clostridia bacterium]|nr:CotH kinase family protein [Clostridia bacterium]
MTHKSKNKCRYFVKLLAVILAIVAVLPNFACIAESSSKSRYAPAESEDFDSYLSDSIPVIRINTDDGHPIDSKTQYKTAGMTIENNNYYANCQNSYTKGEAMPIEVRGRGNSTWDVKDLKVSLKLKLPEKESLFGMDESRHWYLLANYYDVTHLRNKLAYDLSGTMGLYYTQSTWVTLYLNGKKLGLYQLCEAVRIGEECVDIFDWEETAEDVAYAIAMREKLSKEKAEALASEMKNDLSWITSGKYKKYTISDYYNTSNFDITSGYLIEYDIRNDDDRTLIITDRYEIPLHFDNPKRLDTNPEMLEYVTNLFNDFEDALASPTFYNSKGKHYSEYIDMDSFIDFWLVFNIFKNIEFGWLSIFLYIDGGKIYFAPAWDFDNGSGNQVTLREEWMDPSSWFNISGRARWWKMLSFDPNFISRAQTRYFEIREAIDDMLVSMDIYYKYIKNEAIKDYTKIGVRNNWYMKDSRTEGFDEEFAILRKWMYNRIAWLDKQMALREPNIENRGLDVDENMAISIEGSNGKKLPSDRVTLYGAPSDFLYTIKKSGDITVKITLKGKVNRNVSLYINGLRYETAAAKKGVVEFKIPAETLANLSESVAVFTAFYKSKDETLTNFATMRISEYENPDKNEFVVEFGADKYFIEQGKTLKAPKAPVEKPEMIFLGWTSDKKTVYASGEQIPMPTENTVYFPVWQRKDPFVFMKNISYDVLGTSENKDFTANETNSYTVIIIISALVVLLVATTGTAFIVIRKIKRKNKNA